MMIGRHIMAVLRSKERIKVSLLWTVLCILCINAFDDRCCDYLLSGWNGIDDEEFKTWRTNDLPGPLSNVRLFGASRYETNQHRNVFTFLVPFTSPKTVKGFISLSNATTRLITSYFNGVDALLADEFHHTSPGLQPQYHFFKENITDATLFYVAFYLTGASSIQFDILGCDMIKEDKFEGENLLSVEFVPLAVEDLPPGIVIGEHIPTQIECGHLCFDLTSCVAFSINTESGRCIAYENNTYGNFLQSEIRQQSLQDRRSYYFYNYGLTRTLDFHKNVSVLLMYRIYTVRKTRVEAAKYCARFSADLLLLSNIPQMTSVQEKIKSSTVLSHEGPYFVGGNYSAGVWQYQENVDIPTQLWSSGPSSTAGHCVALGNDGLRSYDCDQKLFFICAI